MPSETIIAFNIGAGTLLTGTAVFFFALLAVIWKGKSEIADAVKKEIDPFRDMVKKEIDPFRKMAYAITEIQTILRNKFKDLNIQHSMIEKAGSPLRPTAYGAQLIRDSGLEKILNDNKDLLCLRLKASLKEGYTDYDVQENARNLLVSLKDDPMMRPVKEYVYNHPINIEVILQVGGLWLRDDFLKEPRKEAA